MAPGGGPPGGGVCWDTQVWDGRLLSFMEGEAGTRDRERVVGKQGELGRVVEDPPCLLEKFAREVIKEFQRRIRERCQ